MSRFRLWSVCFLVMAVVSLGGFLLLTSRLSLESPFRAFGIFAIPGLVGTLAVGGSVHGGGFGDWRDYLVVPAISGVCWGTVLWLLVLTIHRFRARGV